MRGLVVLFVILLALPTTLAIDQVIINSHDWRDIYTGIIYAQLTGKDAHYVAEKTQGLQLINEVLDKEKRDILLIESEKPLIFGYQSHLENAGFTVEKYVSSDPYETNLEFAQKAVAESNIGAFIIVDADLGYNAISVAPYATLNHAFVLFTKNDNIDEVSSFVEQNGETTILYGRLDREISLRAFNNLTATSNFSALITYRSGLFTDGGVAAEETSYAFGVSVNGSQRDFRNNSQVDYELVVPVNTSGLGGVQTYFFFLDVE